MEPEDFLGGGPGETPAGADELRSIVARASKRRWRASAVVAGAALAIGGGVGYAVSNHSSPAQTVVAGSSSTTSGGSANLMSPLTASGGGSFPSSVGSAIGMVGSGEKYSYLFTRTTGSVTIRGYQTHFTMPKLPGDVASCIEPLLGPGFVAEVSTPAAVATLSGYQTGLTDVVKSVASSVIGEQEGSPTAVVVAYTGSSVASVKVQFANGQTDQMTPVDGWAVLASSFPSVPSGLTKPVGTLRAFDGNGQVVKSMTVDLGTTPVSETPLMVPACGCPATAGGVTSSQSGSGVASSGGPSPAGTEVRKPAATNVLCPAKGNAPTGTAAPVNG